MIYPELAQDYFGVKISFNYQPITGLKLKEFVFSSHELLEGLLQRMQLFHETISERILPWPQITFPLYIENLSACYRIATLLNPFRIQAQEKNVVDCFFDIGGRKIFISNETDRYAYDRGQLPAYAIRKDLAPIDNKPSADIIVMDEDKNILLKAESTGAGPVTNLKGNQRITYPDFYELLEKHYGTELNSAVIVRIFRLLFQGCYLPEQHAKVLPVLLATLFVSEPSRNRACILANAMLLDLIQARVALPTKGNTQDFYSFKNCLWHPDLYYLTRKQREAPENAEKGQLGGFFPMAHIGSYQKEFDEIEEDLGPFQAQNKLTWSHVKSIVILIDWLCHLSSDVANFCVTRLNKAEYQRENENYLMKFDSIRMQASQASSLILNSFLLPVVKQKWESAESMLSLPSTTALSDLDYKKYLEGKLNVDVISQTQKDWFSLTDEDKRRDALLKNLEARAQVLLAEHAEKVKAYEQQKYEKLRNDVAFVQSIDLELASEINAACIDIASCADYLKNKFDKFEITKKLFKYCGRSLTIPLQRQTFLISKLLMLKAPLTYSLSSFIMAIEPDERKMIYRLIFNSPEVESFLTKDCKDKAIFITRRLCAQIPMYSYLIDTLLEPLLDDDQIFLEKLSGKELFSLCENSDLLFKQILLHHYDIAKKMIPCVFYYQLDEFLMKLKTNYKKELSPEDVRLIQKFKDKMDKAINEKSKLRLLPPKVEAKEEDADLFQRSLTIRSKKY